jgi:hypothetical protein
MSRVNQKVAIGSLDIWGALFLDVLNSSLHQDSTGNLRSVELVYIFVLLLQ